MPPLASFAGSADLVLPLRFDWDRPHDQRYYLGRGALGLAIAAGHLLIIWLVLALNGWAGQAPPRDRALTMVDIARPEKPDAPAKPATAVVVSDRPRIVLPSPLTMFVPAEASGTGAGHGCNMAAAVGKSIAENPAAMAAVAALPRTVRSDTDAVMLWNGSWLDTGFSSGIGAGSRTEPSSPLGFLPGVPSLLGQDPVITLKTVILAAIETAPPGCLETESLGPQLIPIAEPGHYTMLVIGSGAWRWSSLRDPVVDPAALPGAAQPAGAEPIMPAPAGN